MKAPATDLFLELTTELLERGNQVRFRAEGASMHPAIRSGEVVLVEPAAAVDLKKGDICLYLAPRGVAVHRLIRTDGTAFLMRGDPRRFAAEQVGREQILGRVVAVERGGRRISLTGWRAGTNRRIYALASRMRDLGVGLMRPVPPGT